MEFLILYLVTAVLFLGIDAAGLNFLIKPVFDEQLGDWILSPPRYGPALAFYAFYAFVLCYLITSPHLAEPNWGQMMLHAALFGAAAYGTYEFSNLATLERWSWNLVAYDLTWGTVLTTVSATAGLAITRAFTT